MLTQARLKEVLSYDRLAGVFTWCARMNSRAAIGARAGCVNGVTGYRQIRIDGVGYLEHRLAVLWMTGRWPVDELDHINLDKSDNRWSNLRVATTSQNHGNTRKSRRNTSGFKGVTRPRDAKKWWAFAMVNGKQRNLGSFDTREEAHAAYWDASKQYFGEFARRA